MFLDQIDSPAAQVFASRFPALRDAFSWIRAMPAGQPDGIVELRGTSMYVNVHGYATAPASACRWESHRHTIDVQYCIDGGECIDWMPPGSLAPMNDYDATRDVEHWLPADPVVATRLCMSPRTAVVFLPGELHRPKVADGAHGAVRKLVVKIHADLLSP